jgi:hypothetical protein
MSKGLLGIIDTISDGVRTTPPREAAASSIGQDSSSREARIIAKRVARRGAAKFEIVGSKSSSKGITEASVIDFEGGGGLAKVEHLSCDEDPTGANLDELLRKNVSKVVPDAKYRHYERNSGG